ncbi:hypothetical protein HNQ07_000589 [Deinococcus metalli]|nr:hypothetical protein [Deinococcus metalli]MBB5375145.1 hypothetical protein [Deinococcus metalli]
MKRLPVAAMACLVLASCTQVPRTEIFLMDVRSVKLPASVAATDPMDVVVEVTVGGCRRFDHVEGARTASHLTLLVYGRQPAGTGVPCTADIGWEKHTYTDPGTPARTAPFEVTVNGTGRGIVDVH